MQLEDMSKDELIALVKRQEQELAAQPVQQPAPAPAFDAWYHRKTHMSREHAQISFDAGYAAAGQQPAPVEIPEGWRVDRCSNGRIAVQKSTIGGYAAMRDDDNIASSVLYALAHDMLAAPVAAPVAMPAASVQPELPGPLNAGMAEFFLGSVPPDSGRDTALEEVDGILKLIEKMQDDDWPGQGAPATELASHWFAAYGRCTDRAGHARAILALAAHPANVAQVGELSDEQIDDVWQAMPGGPDAWLRNFGYQQFARAIIAAMSAPAKTHD